MPECAPSDALEIGAIQQIPYRPGADRPPAPAITARSPVVCWMDEPISVHLQLLLDGERNDDAQGAVRLLTTRAAGGCDALPHRSLVGGFQKSYV